MKSILLEELYRIKSIMGIITESKVTLPIKISGEYFVPDIVPNKGDALHSFNRRKSDGFGGYMLKGNPPAEWSPYVKLNQNKGINQVLEELWKQGINPDVTDLKIDVNSKTYTVKWEATIDESKDGNAYIGMSSVGSAGQGADVRAQGQIPKMKTWFENSQDYTLVLDFVNPSGIYIRQFFYKWTNPKKYPPHNNPLKGKNDDIEIDIEKNEPSIKTSIESFFKDWKPGEYKLDTDKMWSYRLTDNKEWEAKKPGMEFVNLKTALSPENYDKALNILKNSTKI